VVRRRAAIAVAALVAVLALPATAGAHATLEGTTPARGAQLARAPGLVTLHFDESVDAALGAVQVFDAGGKAVQQGPAFHPGGNGSDVAVRLPAGLRDGGYTVTYRVISADSHPVSGGFTFTVGAGPVGRASVADLLRGQTAGPVTATAFSVVRAVQYAAIALGVGGLIFGLVCFGPGIAAVRRPEEAWEEAEAAFDARQRGLLLVAAAGGVLSAVAGIGLEAAVGEGSSLWRALHWSIVRDVLGTRFGVVWALAAGAWLLAGAWALSRVRLAWLLAPLGLLVLLPALSGHAGTQSPVAVMAPANVIHVIAMCAWLGGIAGLVLALRAATRKLEPPDRTRLLSAVVGRFSALAGVAFAVLLATGVIQGIVEVASIPALVNTAFGRAVLIKVVLFAGLVGIGWVNRYRLIPALRGTGDQPARAGAALRQTLRLELAVGVVVLAVTGALAGYAPSTAVSSGPVTRTATAGPAHLQVTVDPATVGMNSLHLYLFDHMTGAPFTGAKEISVTAALPAKGIAPIPLEVHRAGPGHAIGSGTLGVAGTWDLAVTVRTSAFDEYVAHLTVPIR
jgi:copper transport protein